MRQRGRPELPWEYWDDLARYEHVAGHMLPVQAQAFYSSPPEWGRPVKLSPQGLEYFRSTLQRAQQKKYTQFSRKFSQGLSLACQKIIKDGPLRWVRVSDNTIVAVIKDWKTLRVRITEARQHPRPEPEPPITTNLWQGSRLLRGKHRGFDWDRFLKAYKLVQSFKVQSFKEWSDQFR